MDLTYLLNNLAASFSRIIKLSYFEYNRVNLSREIHWAIKEQLPTSQ